MVTRVANFCFINQFSKKYYRPASTASHRKGTRYFCQKWKYRKNMQEDHNLSRLYWKIGFFMIHSSIRDNSSIGHFGFRNDQTISQDQYIFFNKMRLSKSLRPLMLLRLQRSANTIFFENWLMKHKWASLQTDIYYQKSQSSGLFTLDHFFMRNPAADT